MGVGLGWGGGHSVHSERISAVRLTWKTPESRHKDDGWLGGLLFVPALNQRPGDVTANKVAQCNSGATAIRRPGCFGKSEWSLKESPTHGDQKIYYNYKYKKIKLDGLLSSGYS